MSGDGRVLAFESTEDIAGAGGFESFRAIRANVAVVPATYMQVGVTRAPAPAISQDGSRIAFASKDNPLGTNADANSEIFLHDGAGLIQLTNTSPGDLANRVVNGNFLPSISDDGRYVAFSSNRDLAGQNADGNLEIFIYDSVALEFTQLTNSSAMVGFSDAKISGNGAFVAYIRDATHPTPNPTPNPTPSAKRDLLLQSRTGATPLRVLATDVQSIAMTHGRAISDDGTRVVWAAETAPNATQVFLFDARNNITRQITALGSRATDVPLHATISGDGSRIAFATRRSFLGNSDGSVDLYSFDIPSASFGLVTNGPATATAEVVSSLNDDGSLVAFNFPRILSGASNPDFVNNSEIYVTTTPARPMSGTLTVVNGASFGNEPAATNAMAPDSIAVARGSVLANRTELPQPHSNGNFPLTVGGATVTVNGRPAQIIFVSPTQVNFLVPPETELGTAEVIVTNSDNFPSRGTVTTLRAAPGVFTFSGDGLGEGVVLDASTLLPSPFDPTNGNLRLIVFSTGVRNGAVSASAGGRALTVESIFASPTMPGLDEIHVMVPADLRGAGKVDLVVHADGRDSNPAALYFDGDAKRDIVINEFLVDPPDGAAGDANHDGVRSTSDDEFVELVNTTTNDIDVSGYQILARGTGADTIRHTFASGTILPACTAIAVFGGGNPGPDNPVFGGSQILEASAGSLNLINSAGVITLRDQAANILNFVSYGGSTGVKGDANQSVTRSPDKTGAFTLHQSAAGVGGPLFSPGTHIIGTPFNPCTPISHVEVSPSSTTVEAGGQQQFTARAFDDAGNEVSGVIFTWQSSNAAAATVDKNGLANALSAGSTQIRATGRRIQSSAATLTVNPATPVLTSVAIAPATATSHVGETQQFTAQAKDQFGQNIGGVTIEFSSNNSAVATVDMVRGTSDTGSVTATVTGRASGTIQIAATASNASTSVSSSAAILTVEPGAGQLLISEFRTRGPNGAADEFIEIYNPTLSTQTIGGLRIRISNNAGSVSDRITIPLGTTLLSGRHYLVTNSSANTGYSAAVPGNQTYAAGIADDGGIVITGSNATSIIDAVGVSSGSAYKEGTTLVPLTNSVNQSYERKPGGASGNGTDTNNNAGDFLLNAGSSNPQNTDSPGLDLNSADLSLTQTDSPDPVTTGADLTYTIIVSNNGPGTAQSVVITDSQPASVDFVSCSSTAGGACSGVGNNRTISFSSLASGAFATITLVVNVNGPAGSVIDNTALAASATSDPVLANNSATATTVVQPVPSILSINDVIGTEGNSGTTTFTFTVSSSNPAPASGITFDLATQDNTATTANKDYSAGTLVGQTIPAGQQTYKFAVTVNGDLLVEPNETFFVNLTNVSGATISDGQGLGTIQNDDLAPAATLTINDIATIEGNGGTTTLAFTVTSSLPAPAGGISFDIATAEGVAQDDNPANDDNDYVARSLVAQTIPAGQQIYSFTVIVNGDLLVESDETLFVNLSKASGAIVADGQGIGTIQNDDTANLVISQVYGGGGNSGAQFTHDFVEIFNRGTTTVNFAATPYSIQYAGGTASFGANKVDLTSGGIAPGKYFLIQLSSGGANGTPLPAPDASGSINMAATAGKVVLIAGTTALEAASCPLGAPVSDLVGYGTTADCFEGSNRASAPSAIAANFRKAEGCTDTNDNAADFLTTAPAPRNTRSPAHDCSAPVPTLTINHVLANEGNSGTTSFTLTVALSAPAPAGGISFDIATQDDTATVADSDYVARSLTSQTIQAGNLAYTFEVMVNGDLKVEPNETFFVNVSNVFGATVGDGQGQGTIQNDDATPNATLAVNDVAAIEGNNGTTTLTFTVSSSLPAPAGGIAFDISTGDGSAKDGDTVTDDNDYVARTLTAQTVPAGQQTYMFAVTVNGDLLVEPNETFFVNLTNVSGATIADGLGLGTIQNDDTAKLVISQVYTGGGNSGAQFINDFVEIFNHGMTTVDFAVAPYSIQYAGATANFGSNKLDLTSGTIAPGKYFLVQMSSGGAIGVALPTPDASGSINLAATAGKVSLVAGTTSLPVSTCPGDDGAAPFNPNHGTMADLIGYGSSAVCYEGPTGPAPLPSATTADFRKLGGCMDTDDNPSDFFVAAPAPRTTSSPAHDCNAPPLPTLTIHDASILEGNGPVTFNLSFKITLSAPAPAGGVSFDIATADNTATVADGDYLPWTLTSQTIPAGDLTYTLNVEINSDLKIEPDETFFVNVTNISHATAVDGQGLGTIQNDDNAVLTINDVSANELNSGTTALTFTVASSLPAPPGGIAFDIATANGTAQHHYPPTEDNDYVAKSLTAQRIPAGNTTYTFQVTVNGDTLVEPNETFLVNLTNVSGGIVSDGQGQGIIQNDDHANLVISQIYTGGGNSGARYTNDFVELFNRGSTTIDFAVTPYSVQYAGATANFGSNKANLTSGTIGPGKYFLVQLSSSGAIGAALPTPDASGNINMAATAGKVALVVGTAALNATGCPTGATISDSIGYGPTAICFEGASPAPSPNATTADFRKAGGCIDTNDNANDFLVSAPFPRNSGVRANNCVAGAPPRLTIDDVTVTEGNAGTTIGRFNVSLSAVAPSSDITFDIATQNNTATAANNDYVSKTLSGQIIPAGQLTYTFAVTVNGDTAIEPDETFFVNVTNVTGATLLDGQGIGTIQHDDLPALSINDVSLSEGNEATKVFTFIVGLSAPAPAAVTFDIATQDNSATVANHDYVARSLSAQTIPTASQNYTFQVNVNGDVSIEPNESFFVNLTNVSGATVSDPQASGTILNDDTPNLTIDDVSAIETDGGTTTLTFTVTSSLPAPAGGIIFDFATADGTAQDDNPASEDNDYVASSLIGQTIAAAATTKTFQVTINGDTLVEQNETFLVNITNASGATVADGQGQGTIQNDDTADLVISQVYPGGGNSGAQFTHDFVEVFNHGTTTINFAATPYSIQYAGATANFGSNKVDLTSGTLAPGRYFLVQLSSSGANGVALPTPNATGSIAMAATAGKVALVTGTTALTGSGCPVISRVADLLGYGTTAACFEGSGRAPTPGNTTADLRKAGGCTDTNDNANDFLVTAPFPRNTSWPANNCVAGTPPNLTIDDVTVTEGNSGSTAATFTVSLSAPAPSTDVTLDIATQNNTATTANSDYVAKTLTGQIIPAGQTTHTFTVTINGDLAVENNETLFINVTNVSGATLLDGQGVATILNDDFPTLSINDVSLTEGNAGTKLFTFNLSLSSPAPTGGVTFDIATADATAQDGVPGGEDTDYVPRILTAQTIPAGSQTYSFDVTVNGDLNIETNETFLVNVTNVVGASVTHGQGQGTIQNDDSPSLTIGDVSAKETNSATTTFTFTVTSSLPAPAGGITFDIATADGSAQDDTPPSEDNDYLANSLTGQTITGGNTTRTFQVTVSGDTLVEPNETFFVNVTNVSGATVSDGQGMGTIQNDDAPLLVITQIYPGGGLAGAAFTNDFIEIFNSGTTTIDFAVTPYSVQFLSTGAATWVKTDLTTKTIAPGQYFLVQGASGGVNGSALPAPDATGTINLTSTTPGKVALVPGTTLLAGSCPGDNGVQPFNPVGAVIMDFVGYGGTAATTNHCYEGSGPAPFSTSSDQNRRSTIRTTSCTDTNVNSADFTNPTNPTGATPPVPRNKATTISSCPQ